MSLHVAVVIVGFNNAGDVSQCIAALDKSTYRNFEIVICENSGDAGFSSLQSVVPERLSGGQLIRLIKAPSNGGYASGINICMSNSTDADAWWILNPDTEPSPAAMAALVDHMLQGFDAVGGPLHFPSGEIQSFGGVWLSWYAKAVAIGHGSPASTKQNSASVEQKQNFLMGASMFVSRKFAKVTGPMAEHFFLYCEEVEWCLRGISLGMRLGFAPEAMVVHHQGTSTGYTRSLKTRSCRAVYLDERNKMLLTWDRFPARLPVAAVMALYRLVGRYGRVGAFAQVAYGMAGWFLGLCGQSGIPRWARKASG
jgi:N-acetylglucosaminyl-diphospho-decaprenol L-rhamnosyltransferase